MVWEDGIPRSPPWEGTGGVARGVGERGSVHAEVRAGEESGGEDRNSGGYFTEEAEVGREGLHGRVGLATGPEGRGAASTQAQPHRPPEPHCTRS